MALTRRAQDTTRGCGGEPIASFLRRLHRDGEWAYLWTPEGSRSAWYPVGKMLPTLGDNARNVLFGVHAGDRIPGTNARGERVPPEQVRAQQAYVSVVNCLFAEFDVGGPAEDKAALLMQVRPTKQQRQATLFRKCIGKAVTEVQGRRMASLAEPPPCCTRGFPIVSTLVTVWALGTTSSGSSASS